MSLVSAGLTGVIIALWRTLLNSEVIMRIYHLLLHNITSQGNDNVSQNEIQWIFKGRNVERFYSVRTNRMIGPSDANDLGRPCNILLEFQVVRRYVFTVV